jgi:regulator of protease activity HflC (stomatin/prohibitin superfamily)
MTALEIVIVVGAVAMVALLLAVKAIWVIPPARAANVERLGRYKRTLQSGLNVVMPGLDQVKPQIDLREQMVSFANQRVITADNLVVLIETVLFYQVTDPRAADYEIVDYNTAIGKLCVTMLRSVIGSMELQQTLSSREEINAKLRGVLDAATGKWGIRVTRVEIKDVYPEPGIMDAMEKQYRAQREKRAKIAVAEGDRQAAILRSEGEAAAIGTVFKAIHDGKPDPELLAYKYVQALPWIARGQGNSVWMIPSEVTTALRNLSSAFGNRDADLGTGRQPDVSPPGPRSLSAVSGEQSARDRGPAGREPDDGAEPDAGAEPSAGRPPKAA